MRILFLLLILASCASYSYSQDKGKVEIIKDSRIDSLIKKQKSINEQKKTVPGFRIQIYFGNQRNKASEIRALFLQKYPSYAAYIIYQQPNFKIRVGDFYTRLEAFKFYKQLQTEYESAFIVKDEIKTGKQDQ